MRNLLLVFISIFFTSLFLEWDKIINIPNESILNYILGSIVFIDFLLGTTEKFYSNSVIEAVLRSIGRLVFYVFNLEKKGYRMDKKTKR